MILKLSDLDQGDQNYVAHEILYYIHIYLKSRWLVHNWRILIISVGGSYIARSPCYKRAYGLSLSLSLSLYIYIYIYIFW